MLLLSDIRYTTFADTLGGGVTCVQTQYLWVTVATQRIKVGHLETGAQGSVIFSLLSNTAVSNISDFKDKRIGFGYILSPDSYQLGNQVHQFPTLKQCYAPDRMFAALIVIELMQVLLKNGFNVFTDTKQVRVIIITSQSQNGCRSSKWKETNRSVQQARSHRIQQARSLNRLRPTKLYSKKISQNA